MGNETGEFKLIVELPATALLIMAIEANKNKTIRTINKLFFIETKKSFIALFLVNVTSQSETEIISLCAVTISI